MQLAACALGALAACAVDDRAVSVAGGGTRGDGTAESGAGGMTGSGGTIGGGPGGTAGSGAANAGGSNGGMANGGSSNGGSSNGGMANGGSGGLDADAGGGGCMGAQCVPPPAECAVDTVSLVPFTTNWSSVGKSNLYNGGCDSLGTPDYALVFIAPQAGMYRVRATAFVDSVPYTGADPSGTPTNPADGDAVMTVAFDSCAGSNAPQVDCNDDFSFETLDSQSNLNLDAGDVVTVYLNELSQTGGGTGTVSIELRP